MKPSPHTKHSKGITGASVMGEAKDQPSHGVKDVTVARAVIGKGSPDKFSSPQDWRAALGPRVRVSHLFL